MFNAMIHNIIITELCSVRPIQTTKITQIIEPFVSHDLKWRKENKTSIPGKMWFHHRNFNLIDIAETNQSQK